MAPARRTAPRLAYSLRLDAVATLMNPAEIGPQETERGHSPSGLDRWPGGWRGAEVPMLVAIRALVPGCTAGSQQETGRESFNCAFLFAILVIEQSLVPDPRGREERTARARASETVLLHATGV